jgi:hypothetical protein
VKQPCGPRTAFTYLFRERGLLDGSAKEHRTTCVYALVARPLPLVLGLAQVGGIVYNSFLLGRAALGAATNITVNEDINVARYEYLQGGHGGTFLNPFDEGAAANCEQFFRDPAQHPDWEAVAAASSGGKGAGRTGGWQRDLVFSCSLGPRRQGLSLGAACSPPPHPAVHWPTCLARVRNNELQGQLARSLPPAE